MTGALTPWLPFKAGWNMRMSKAKRTAVVVVLGSVACAFVAGCPPATGKPSAASRPAAPASAPVSATPEAAAKACADFLSSPTAGNYDKARTLLMASSTFDPYADDLSDLQELVEANSPEAMKKFARMQPNYSLSPRAHLLASMAAKKAGQEAAARSETELYLRCLGCLLSTGDGTAQRPFKVMRVADEYDVLRHLKKPAGRQALMHREGRSYDVFVLPDGKEMWFDVTEIFQTLTRQFKGG